MLGTIERTLDALTTAIDLLAGQEYADADGHTHDAMQYMRVARGGLYILRQMAARPDLTEAAVADIMRQLADDESVSLV